jgi:hypothetical protein
MTAIAGGHGLAGPDVDPRILADLRHWRVSTVVVGPMPHQQDMVSLFTRVLSAPPSKRGGVYVWSTAQSPRPT